MTYNLSGHTAESPNLALIRRLKVQCDEERPCKNCVKRGLDCGKCVSVLVLVSQRVKVTSSESEDTADFNEPEPSNEIEFSTRYSSMYRQDQVQGETDMSYEAPGPSDTSANIPQHNKNRMRSPTTMVDPQRQAPRLQSSEFTFFPSDYAAFYPFSSAFASPECTDMGSILGEPSNQHTYADGIESAMVPTTQFPTDDDEAFRAYPAVYDSPRAMDGSFASSVSSVDQQDQQEHHSGSRETLPDGHAS